jgi:adenosylcobinamide-GDP ribazoletransferase
MRSLLPIRVAFSFLTRLPIETGQVPSEDLGRAVGYFPLVGAALGAACLGAAALLQHALPASLIGLVTVLIAALVTGGLHLDGVADLFDGLSGGRGDRQRTLSIMRDSHIGAHGAAALMLLLIGKVLASGELVTRAQLLPIFAAPVVARLGCVVLVTGFGYAREAGLGRAMRDHAGAGQLAVAFSWTLLFSAPLFRLSSLTLLAACAAALASVWIVGAVLARRLGGLTGDAYGAGIELCELAVLVFACAG